MFEHLDGEHPVKGLVCYKIVHIASDAVDVLDALQDILIEAGIIDKGGRLDVIDSDQSKILDQAGY